MWRITRRKAVDNFDARALRQARERAGLTQAEMAKRLKMARTNYIRFEAGHASPIAATLVAMAKALGVNPQDLTTTAPNEVTLRDLRNFAGLTPQQVAERLGYRAARTYRDIENGHKTLAPDLATPLARVFKVPKAELLAAWERTISQL